MRLQKFFLDVIVFTIICGCSAAARVESVDNVFLTDVDVSKKLSNLPFDHSWVWSKRKTRTDYDTVYVKPIRTDTLNPENWTRSASILITSRDDYDERAREVANHFHDKVVEEFRMYPKSRYPLAAVPGPRVMVLEIALTELEFSHPVARAGALIVPVPGTGAALSTVSDPHAAFAARITDGSTGELLATAADRKFPPIRILAGLGKTIP